MKDMTGTPPQLFQPTLMMADFTNDGCVSSNLQQKLKIEAKLMPVKTPD
jgi:hypothetical protein